jgi:putative chitinase
MAQGALLLACERFALVEPLERAHFFAQCAHESAGFTKLVENLNYSADGLANTWPTRFAKRAGDGEYVRDPVSRRKVPNDTAKRLSRNPERIANAAYANRLGNGDAASGDGWKFRGRGYIQLTGRANYQQVSMAVFGDNRLLDCPELLEQPQHAALAAGFFWTSRHLSIHALKDDLEGVTRGVNGGLIGLEDRRQWLRRFKVEFDC